MKHSLDAILQPEQGEYLESLEGPRDQLLAEMEAFAAQDGQPISDPEVASFLSVTTRARAPRFVVEVGTNIGYGAIVLARAAGPDARVLTMELSPKHVARARGYIERAGLSARVEVREGKALEILAALPSSPAIDLAYIDCVKEEYTAYLDQIVPRLADRGVIVADNVLWRGFVAKKDVPAHENVRAEALRAFNRAIVGHPSLRAVVLPLGDGVAYAVKR